MAGNNPSIKLAISSGKTGGGVDGYAFAVQSYCPPRVIQRNFLFITCVILSGLWTAGLIGSNLRSFAAVEKNDAGFPGESIG